MIKHLKNLTHTAKTHQGFRRYFTNTSWMFAEQMLRMVAGLFVGIWVARYLGPEQFGVFSYSLAFASIFSGIAKLGLDKIVVRNLVQESEKRDRYLGTAFWLKFLGALLMFGFVSVALELTSNDSITKSYILIITSGAIFQSFEVVDFYFQSKVLSKFVSICKVTQLIVSSLLKLYFIYKGADLIYFVYITLIDQCTLAFTLFFAYRSQRLGSFYWNFDWALAKKILNDSWPLIFSGLVIMIYMRIDQIMIKEMLGEKDVGLFSAAVRLSEVWYFIPSIITSSLLPALINAKKNNEVLYLQRLQKLITLLVWLAIAIALPISCISSLLITSLYGNNYEEASVVLAIHVWGSIFVFLGVGTGVYFTVENYTKKMFYRTASGAVLNILFNFLLIPKYGISGAAFSTLMSQFFVNFLCDFFDSALRKLAVLKLKALLPLYFFNI